MFSISYLKRLAVIIASAVIGPSIILSASAAPGTLATAPLFLSSIVEPNVYFTIDDSGSMDWNPMMAEDVGAVNGVGGISAPGGQPVINSRKIAYYTPRNEFNPIYDAGTDADEYGNTLPPTHGGPYAWVQTWMVRNHNANLNYYNPDVKYEPWPGLNADGTPMFTNADPKNALMDPFLPLPGGHAVDLTVSHNNICEVGTGGSCGTLYIPTYYVWEDDVKIPTNAATKRVIDTNTDGKYTSADGNAATPNGIIEYDDGRLEVIIEETDVKEMQNFANWFQYYRSRMNATKAIIGSTINNTSATRMGMRTFNDGAIEIPGTNTDLNVESMTDLVKKRALLNAFYHYDVPGQGTPMREALKDVGDFFDNSGSNAPILDAANGGECQQNFNILMGDGFWNGSDPSNIDNHDKDSEDDDEGNTIFDGTAAQSNDGGNYADEWSKTLADVAMRDYERDLRGNLANKVPISEGVDLATHQHLVTYSIAFGINGTLDPANPDHNPLSPNFPGWPDPDDDNDAAKVDDMWHAAYNGRGEFFSAQQPDTLQASLKAAISDIAERTATAAAVSINSAKLTTQSVVYLAQFNTNGWQGDLQAFKIADLDTGELATTPEWSAAEVLDKRKLNQNPRTILTYDGSEGTPFQWSDLKTNQKKSLRTNPEGTLDVGAVGKQRLKYLRGKRNNEGAGHFFRERQSRLADIVNSGPVFVAGPDLNWPDTAPFPTTAGARYSDYKNGPAKNRPGVIYVGSNGGLLHGFSETDGEELLAYVSNTLYSRNAGEGLHYLTDPDYDHTYYNDLTPTVSDIYANLGVGDAWNTIIVGGLRGGGRGLFALDVTDPTQFSEDNAEDIVLWEFTNDDDDDLGFTYSRPQIALANNDRWVAIFGNGYNDTGDGEAKLFIVDIEKGVDGDWDDSGDYIEISTNVGDATDRNGLATPALADLDGNGTVDRIYGGDLRGNMWVFDLSDSDAGQWGLTSSSPLFTTIGNRPITSKPTLAKHPTVQDESSNAPNVLVYFGSGQYLVDADKSSTFNNYFYGVWDRGDSNLASTNLVQQTFRSGFPARVLTRNPVNYLGGEYGWYFSLSDSGERSVTNPVVRGSNVFFNSFVPVTDPCSVGGFGYRFAVDLLTGGSPEESAIDYNNDGIIDENDRVNDSGGNIDTVAAIKQEGFLPEPVFIEDIAYTAETPTKVVKLKEVPSGRFSWQELIP